MKKIQTSSIEQMLLLNWYCQKTYSVVKIHFGSGLLLGTLSKRKNDIIWEIFPTWGGVFPNPKTFVNLPSIFLYAKFILRC